MNLPPIFLILTIFVSFIAAIIHTTSGIGYAMLSMAVYSLYIPKNECAAIVNAGMFILLVIMQIKYRNNIRWRELLGPAISMIVGKITGIFVMTNLSGTAIRMSLGILLIAFSLYFFIIQNKLHMKPNIYKGILLGLAAGLLGGTYNIAGPFMAIYFFPMFTDKEEYMATINASFIPSSASGVIMHGMLGNFTGDALHILLLCAAGIVAGGIAGMKLYSIMNKTLVARILYSYMIVMGLVLVCF